MNDAAMSQPLARIADQAQFVTWLRQVAPYVHAHRGRTFVVAFSGSLIASGQLTALVQDISLLSAMGIRIVLVQNIGLATIAALIGGGGFGVFVFQGVGQTAMDLVLLGAVPTVALAFAAAIILDAVIEMTATKRRVETA